MQFYCPQCQKTVEAEIETTLTTKLNQTAYKSHCPVCKQDMTVYGVQGQAAQLVDQAADVDQSDAQAAVDQALHEFGSSVV